MSKFQIGGQAVIEGLMLRGKSHWVLGVRLPDNNILIDATKLNSLTQRHAFWKLPLVRGCVALIESVSLGMKALTASAQLAAIEEEGEELKGWHMALVIVITVLIATGLFVVTPALFAKFLYGHFKSPILINLLEGSFKISILVAYIWAVSKLKDIARVYEYHGAEHAIIHAYEHGDELVPSEKMAENIRHVRCGTSFLILVMITSILVFSLLGKPPFALRVLYHLAIVPFIAGLSYEIIRIAGRHSDSKFIRFIMAPGLAMQRMTTRTPSNDQLEVAIAAFEKLIEVESAEQVMKEQPEKLLLNEGLNNA